MRRTGGIAMLLIAVVDDDPKDSALLKNCVEEYCKKKNHPAMVQAGIGVAMANATLELKQHADYITTGVDDDGILNALRHFNVIG